MTLSSILASLLLLIPSVSFAEQLGLNETTSAPSQENQQGDVDKSRDFRMEYECASHLSYFGTFSHLWSGELVFPAHRERQRGIIVFHSQGAKFISLPQRLDRSAGLNKKDYEFPINYNARKGYEPILVLWPKQVEKNNQLGSVLTTRDDANALDSIGGIYNLSYRYGSYPKVDGKDVNDHHTQLSLIERSKVGLKDLPRLYFKQIKESLAFTKQRPDFSESEAKRMNEYRKKIKTTLCSCSNITELKSTVTELLKEPFKNLSCAVASL